MVMICTVCGKEAEYNEKLNVYYCKEHGFTTWLVSDNGKESGVGGIKVNEEVALGGAHLR